MFRLTPNNNALVRFGGHQAVQLCIFRKLIFEGHQCAAVAQKAAACRGVGDIAGLLRGNVQKCRQLLPVAGSLIEQDQHFGIRQHGTGLNGIQQILHILRNGGGIGTAFTEATPCGIKEIRAVRILKDHMKFVDEQVRPLAFAPVFRHAVEHSVGDNQKPHGFELTPQIHNVIDNDAVLGVHIGFMGKGIQTAGGEQLQRQRQIAGFFPLAVPAAFPGEHEASGQGRRAYRPHTRRLRTGR